MTNNRFQEKLKRLEGENRLRSLSLPCGIDLSSNDYLGMAQHADLRSAAMDALDSGMALGATGSRLLRGETPAHRALEDYAAPYFSAQKALYFSSGFQANFALFTTLPNRHDVVLFDELVHASARSGIAAGQAASVKLAHNDLNAYEAALKAAHENRRADGMIWLAIESVYSMDGDFASVGDIFKLAQQYDAVLIVDDAHATGVWGPDGKGLAYDCAAGYAAGRLITLHTCGKALGVAGGLVCASADMINTLVNAARPFVYSTAPPPLQAFLVQQSLAILAGEEGAQARQKLHALCNAAQKIFGGAGSQIVPIMLGDDKAALELAAYMQGLGYDIRAIRPPTVPEGTARLRLSLSTHIDESILQQFAAQLLPHLQKREAA